MISFKFMKKKNEPKKIDLLNALKIINYDDDRFDSIEKILEINKKVISKSFNIIILPFLAFCSFLFYIIFKSMPPLDFYILWCFPFLLFFTFMVTLIPNYDSSIEYNKIKSISDLINFHTSIEYSNFSFVKIYFLKKYFNNDFIILSKIVNSNRKLIEVRNLINTNKNNKDSFNKINNYIHACQIKKMTFDVNFLKSLCEKKVIEKEEIPLIEIINTKVKKILPIIEFIVQNDVENKLNLINYDAYHQVKEKYQTYNMIDDENKMIDFCESLEKMSKIFDHDTDKIKLMLNIKETIDKNNIVDNDILDKFNQLNSSFEYKTISGLNYFNNELILHLNIR